MLRIGLLGASRIAPKAVIAPARARDDVTVTAVAARDAVRAEAFAAEHGVPAVAAGYAELVRREDVDLIYNALPPSAHLEWTVAALEAGKAVLCEKPFAMNAGEAQVMADAARRTGLLLTEAFHYRHHRVMHDAVALVRSGALGRPVRAEGRFDVPIRRTDTELRWRSDLGGGALMDLGCYPLHALRTLLGTEPDVVRATADFQGGVDAALDADLEMAGVPVRIATSMVAPSAGARVRVECETGWLAIENFVAPQIGCSFTVGREDRLEAQPTNGPSTYEAQLDHLVKVWRSETPALLAPEDAVANMRAIDGIYAAAGET